MHAFLSELHPNIDENYILPKSCTLMLVRFTEEATLSGYMKDAEGYTKDTKIAAQDEKGDAARPKSTLQKPQLPMQNCTISGRDVGHNIHGWKPRQV